MKKQSKKTKEVSSTVNVTEEIRNQEIKRVLRTYLDSYPEEDDIQSVSISFITNLGKELIYIYNSNRDEMMICTVL
jgi:hypothetical protein